MKNELTKIAFAVLGLAIVLFLSCADNQTLEYPSMDVFFPESSSSEPNASSSSTGEQPGGSSSDGTTSPSSSSLGADGGSSSSLPGAGGGSSSSSPDVGGGSSESQELGSFDGTNFTDPRDGKKYKCEYAPAANGGKLWMSENLNYSRGNTLGYCYGIALENTNPHMDATSCNTSGYGRLYDTWETAMDGNSPRGLCPKGWHIPTLSEWSALGAAEYPNAGNKTAMKSSFYIYSGNFDYGKTQPDWLNRTTIGFYWTSSEKKYFVMMSSSVFQYKTDAKDKEIFSIRCVADDGMFVSSSSVSSSSGGSSVSSSSVSSSSNTLSVSSSSALSVSSSSITVSSSSSTVNLCENFVEGQDSTMHYGKKKAQLCDSRDGKRYAYVLITTSGAGGNTRSLTWMADNLNYNAAGSKCLDIDNDCEKYGRLYDWKAAAGGPIASNVNSLKGVCPNGWRLPNENDWSQLIGGTPVITMKTLLVKEEFNSSCNGEDSQGFSALIPSTDMYFLASTGTGWVEDTNFLGSGYMDKYKRMKFTCNKTEQVVSSETVLSTFSFVRCVK